MKKFQWIILVWGVCLLWAEAGMTQSLTHTKWCGVNPNRVAWHCPSVPAIQDHYGKPAVGASYSCGTCAGDPRTPGFTVTESSGRVLGTGAVF